MLILLASFLVVRKSGSCCHHYNDWLQCTYLVSAERSPLSHRMKSPSFNCDPVHLPREVLWQAAPYPAAFPSRRLPAATPSVFLLSLCKRPEVLLISDVPLSTGAGHACISLQLIINWFFRDCVVVNQKLRCRRTGADRALNLFFSNLLYLERPSVSSKARTQPSSVLQSSPSS